MQYKTPATVLFILASTVSVFAKQDELANKIKSVIGSNKKFADIPEVNLAGIVLSKKQKDALVALEDIRVEGVILETLNAVEKEEAAPTAAGGKAKSRRNNFDKESIDIKVKKILVVAKDGKITDKAFKHYEETFLREDQYNDIKEHESRIKKPLTEAELGKYFAEGILVDDFAKVSELKTENNSKKVKELAEVKEKQEKNIKALAEKIKSAIPEGGKFTDLKEGDIIKLELSAEQRLSLQRADPKKDSDILSILKSSVIHDNKDSERSKKGEDAWYKSSTALVISCMLAAAAIGGGVYIMTRKSIETEI